MVADRICAGGGRGGRPDARDRLDRLRLRHLRGLGDGGPRAWCGPSSAPSPRARPSRAGASGPDAGRSPQAGLLWYPPRMNSERFAQGMTFDEYVKFIGSPENLAREGFDIRRFSLVRPRMDWSALPPRALRRGAAQRRADRRHPVAGRAAGRARQDRGDLRGLVVGLPARRAVPGAPGRGGRPRAAHLRAGRRHDAAQGPAGSRAPAATPIWWRPTPTTRTASASPPSRWPSSSPSDFAELYRYVEYPGHLPQGAAARPPAGGARGRDRRSRRRRAAARRSAGCSSPRSSTCGRRPRSPRS